MITPIYFHTLMSHFISDNKEIKSWPHLKIGTYDNIRLYYNVSADKKLQFYVLEFHSVELYGAIGDVWSDPKVEVGIMMSGYGYFDGIRHIWVGDEDGDEKGYLYYPNTKALAEIFTKLRELEVQAGLELDDNY